MAERLLEGAATCDADGVVGESAYAMAARLEARLAGAGPDAGPYDVVVILGGTNDLWRCDPAAVAAKLDAVHAVCREALPEADIGICTVPRWCPGVVSGACGSRRACGRGVEALVRRRVSEGSSSSRTCMGWRIRAPLTPNHKPQTTNHHRSTTPCAPRLLIAGEVVRFHGFRVEGRGGPGRAQREAARASQPAWSEVVRGGAGRRARSSNR